MGRVLNVGGMGLEKIGLDVAREWPSVNNLSEAAFGAAQAACGQAIDLLPNGGGN